MALWLHSNRETNLFTSCHHLIKPSTSIPLITSDKKRCCALSAFSSLFLSPCVVKNNLSASTNGNWQKKWSISAADKDLEWNHPDSPTSIFICASRGHLSHPEPAPHTLGSAIISHLIAWAFLNNRLQFKHSIHKQRPAYWIELLLRNVKNRSGSASVAQINCDKWTWPSSGGVERRIFMLMIWCWRKYIHQCCLESHYTSKTPQK